MNQCAEIDRDSPSRLSIPARINVLVSLVNVPVPPITLLNVRLPPVGALALVLKTNSTLPFNVIGPITRLVPLALSSVLPSMSGISSLNWLVALNRIIERHFSRDESCSDRQACRGGFNAHIAALNVNVTERRIHRHARDGKEYSPNFR